MFEHFWQLLVQLRHWFPHFRQRRLRRYVTGYYMNHILANCFCTKTALSCATLSRNWLLLFDADIDECEEEGQCRNGVCDNLAGSYVCTCNDGYDVTPDGRVCIGGSIASRAPIVRDCKF